jgi:DNA polymerase III subunit beta
MDLTVNRTALLEELQLIQGVVDRRTTFPILSNVLLTATGDRLHLAATDLDVTILTGCSAAVRLEGKATISGKVFHDMVRSLPSDSLTLSSQENRVEIRSGSYDSTLASLSPEDFPTLPEAPEGQGFAVKLAALQRLIDLTSFAVSAEEGQFQFNAALLTLGETEMQMVATDGHRLAFASASAPAGAAPFAQNLLPRKVLMQLRRLAGGPDVPLYLARGDNHLSFRIGERVLLSRILEARFPQYERVLVRDNPHRARVQRGEFLAALRRVALLASEKTHGVQISFNEGLIALSSVGFDLGQAAEEVSCSYHGESLRVLVNAQYIIEYLAVLETPEVEFQLRDGEGPVVLVPVALEGEPAVQSLYVIMPIRL